MLVYYGFVACFVDLLVDWCLLIMLVFAVRTCYVNCFMLTLLIAYLPLVFVLELFVMVTAVSLFVYYLCLLICYCIVVCVCFSCCLGFWVWFSFLLFSVGFDLGGVVGCLVLWVF